MKLEEIEIDLIKPYKDNPREISQEAVRKVKNSIKEFGNNQPIVIDQNNVIVVGHTRWKALRELGKTKAFVIKREFENNQAVAYRIMDNRSGAESKWDKQLLMSELQLLKDEKFNLDLTGFDALELKDILLDKDLFEPTSKDDQGRLDEDTKETCPECGQTINGK
nr:ParB-like nuclease domain containing protein [uncultured Mediterranean phage uvMED]